MPRTAGGQRLGYFPTSVNGPWPRRPKGPVVCRLGPGSLSLGLSCPESSGKLCSPLRGELLSLRSSLQDCVSYDPVWAPALFPPGAALASLLSASRPPRSSVRRPSPGLPQTLRSFSPSLLGVPLFPARFSLSLFPSALPAPAARHPGHQALPAVDPDEGPLGQIGVLEKWPKHHEAEPVQAPPGSPGKSLVRALKRFPASSQLA